MVYFANVYCESTLTVLCQNQIVIDQAPGIIKLDFHSILLNAFPMHDYIFC